MILASNLVANLQDLINQYGDLPIIFSTDSGGSSYQKVGYEADIAKVLDLDAFDLEILDMDSENECNCFIIN